MRTFVTLSCGHVNEYDNRKFELFDERMCSRCNQVGFITQIDAQYRISCKTCRYGASFGMSRLKADLAASAHLRRKQGHTVQILAGESLLVVVSSKRFEQTLDLPPF